MIIAARRAIAPVVPPRPKPAFEEHMRTSFDQTDGQTLQRRDDTHEVKMMKSKKKSLIFVYSQLEIVTLLLSLS